jgi:hypothetical protein
MARPRKWTFDALDPSDASGESTVECWIDQGTIHFLTKGVLTQRWFRIQCVADVLRDPIHVVEGWNREGYESARCYIGRPQDHPSEGITLPPKPGMCFLVFVLPNGKIEEWGWEKLDPADDGSCRRQFGEDWKRLWPPE